MSEIVMTEREGVSRVRATPCPRWDGDIAAGQISVCYRCGEPVTAHPPTRTPRDTRDG